MYPCRDRGTLVPTYAKAPRCKKSTRTQRGCPCASIVQILPSAHFFNSFSSESLNMPLKLSNALLTRRSNMAISEMGCWDARPKVNIESRPLTGQSPSHWGEEEDE